MGLFEGTTHLQYLYETNTAAGYNDFNVDILAPGEVINVHTCGLSNTNNIRVQILDSSGATVYDNTAVGTICGSDLNTTFDPAVTNPHQYVATATDTYTVRMFNQNGLYLSRYDVTVTNSLSDLIDPRDNGGRVWSLYWRFNAATYALANSTSANLYVVADGGFVDTYFVWRLDLNNFAGFVYSLTANDLGVDSPNAVGDVVAGISVPTSNNSVQPKYPIYLAYPEKNYPRPVGGVNVSGLGFIDSDGEDSGISPGTTSTIQDSGTFTFSTDLTTSGVYEIVIDNSSPSGGGPDGIYGQGDIYLRGNALPGLNSIVWTGEDNNGNVVPNGAYTAKLSVRTGEFHFTAQDVETSGGPGEPGIKIYRAEGSGLDLPTTVYWDDATVLNSTAADAFNQNGIFDGDHNWGNFNSGGIGNNTYIDTYAFGRVEEPNPVGLAITENDIPLPIVTKRFSPATITTGGTSTLQIEIEYNGVLALSGIGLQDNMPEGMTLASGPGSFSISGAGCSGFTFSTGTVSGGNVIELVDGNIASNSTCLIEAQVTADLPGDLVNTTSGLSSNELATSVVSNGASLFVEAPLGGAAFACDAAIYESETTGSSTRLYQVDRGVDPYVRTEFNNPLYAATSDYTYTALAQSPADNYLYAIVDSSNNGAGVPRVGSILRIDQNGTIANLGVPERGPNTMDMPVVSDRFTGGTIGENGRYVVVTDLSSSSGTGASIPLVERGLILEIDLSTSPPQVLYNRRHGRDIGDLVAHPDGSFYSYNPVEGLITIDPASGSVGIVGGNLSDEVSGLSADAWGDVFAHTETGNLYSVDVATGGAILISVLAGAPSTDSASCPFGLAMSKTVDAVDVAPGDQVTYTYRIVNQSNTSVTFDFTDALADSRQFVDGSLVNPAGGTANDFGDTSELTITAASVAPNSSADLQVSVFYPPDYPSGAANNQALLEPAAAVPDVLSDYPLTITQPDATPVNVLPNPSLGVAKKAIVNGLDVTYEFLLQNMGNTEASNIGFSDNLDAVFGSGNYVFTLPPEWVVDPGTLTLNTRYDGSADDVVLDAGNGSSLAVGQSAVIRFAVRLLTVADTGAGIGNFSNQVSVTFEDLDNNVLTELSVDGDSPDPDGNGFPDEQGPTVISMSQIIQVSGRVFLDNSASPALAHNGVFDSDEVAVAGATVIARNGATVAASATVQSDGTYQLILPALYGNTPIEIVLTDFPGYYAISEYYAQDPGNTGPVTDASVPMVPQLSFQGAYQVDFGLVARPVWESDSVAENTAGATVLHQHRYRPFTSGQLSISTSSEITTPVNTSWQTTLYQDNNCNAAIDSGELLLPASLNVDKNDVLCVISKVIIPADVSQGDSYTVELSAALTYADDSAIGHALSDSRALSSLTRVIADGGGRLTLDKTVQNLSAGGSETTSNVADAGDTLRYRIQFANTGTGPITEVLISDNTPAFTILAAPVQCPAVLPVSVVSCQVLQPAAVENTSGYSGVVQWQFTGTLLAGGRGDVSYDIEVE
jgi:uncharacterized repeat protein (TIGR01451 family)